MKPLALVLIIVAIALVGGSVIYMNHHKTATASAPTVESSTNQVAEPSQADKMAVSRSELPQTISTNASEQSQVAAPVVTEAKPDNSTNAISKAVDALLSAKNAAQKHALFQQLLQTGQLDQAITELQQRASANPNDPEIPTTLGEALLNKVRSIHDSGGDLDQMGILAMQADQSFNAALKIDPQNWEAQFVKASSMYYWPADATRDNGVVQNLSSLIDQQDSMPSQPEFAQTYVLLGNEYQKIGQTDKALATWQLGAQKFPNDPTLQKKISGQ
jgi:tetratricopeptide (TPR) repeat protein